MHRIILPEEQNCSPKEQTNTTPSYLDPNRDTMQKL
jgi:hypothetical protein